MPPKKKSGRITLRMDPAIHRRVEVAAKALGIDINGLLNLIIRKEVPYYEGLVRDLADPRCVVLLPRWRKLNPTTEIDEFYHLFSHFIIRPKGCVFRFEGDKLYRLNDEEDDFVEVTPEEERELKRGASHASKPQE
jgi:hypothetical protein